MLNLNNSVSDPPNCLSSFFSFKTVMLGKYLKSSYIELLQKIFKTCFMTYKRPADQVFP